MRNILKLLTVSVICIALFISCSSDKNAKQQIEANEKEVLKMDSLSNDLDSTINELEKRSKELESEVDDLLKSFE